MSFLDKYLAGWGFRSHTPSFDPGEEITVFVTGHDGDTPVARVGNTILRVENAPADAVDARVRLRVESFDDDAHTGTATYLERVGESAF
ncbi:hypothetical protein NGM10_03925 [Halorussus salilacus]|uniref:DUF7513 family protein n=1 Tax=Halorussus salilacus TaxID=2953750 RepID=UPI00209E53C4|nr:hypothetical protein [Halorussus salilacus]USZ68889.1 hypothetical protein NGM10_03925 [Halorussus salilacus]